MSGYQIHWPHVDATPQLLCQPASQLAKQGGRTTATQGREEEEDPLISYLGSSSISSHYALIYRSVCLTFTRCTNLLVCSFKKVPKVHEIVTLIQRVTAEHCLQLSRGYRVYNTQPPVAVQSAQGLTMLTAPLTIPGGLSITRVLAFVSMCVCVCVNASWSVCVRMTGSGWPRWCIHHRACMHSPHCVYNSILVVVVVVVVRTLKQ